jgi:hypothetical protein
MILNGPVKNMKFAAVGGRGSSEFHVSCFA